MGEDNTCIAEVQSWFEKLLGSEELDLQPVWQSQSGTNLIRGLHPYLLALRGYRERKMQGSRLLRNLFFFYV